MNGIQIDLAIEQRIGGMTTQAIVECKDKRITSDERNQILAQQNLAQKKLPRHRWIAVSSQGFAADTRTALDEAGVDCVTYSELLRDLVPLEDYADSLITKYVEEITEQWQGQDWFIRPSIETDADKKVVPALSYIGKWLGDRSRNFLVLLGDLGVGKTTLSKFLCMTSRGVTLTTRYDMLPRY